MDFFIHPLLCLSDLERKQDFICNACPGESRCHMVQMLFNALHLCRETFLGGRRELKTSPQSDSSSHEHHTDWPVVFSSHSCMVSCSLLTEHCYFLSACFRVLPSARHSLMSASPNSLQAYPQCQLSSLLSHSDLTGEPSCPAPIPPRESFGFRPFPFSSSPTTLFPFPSFPPFLFSPGPRLCRQYVPLPLLTEPPPPPLLDLPVYSS